MEGISLSDTDAALKCIDRNEILFDDEEKYLKRITSANILFPENLYAELLRNVESCQNVFFMYLKQHIILQESRVRYNPVNDISGLDEKIHTVSLSSELKSSLREISSIGYKLLKDGSFLKNLVEFDIDQPASVVLFDRQVEMVGKFDMLTLLDNGCNMTLDEKYTHTDKKKVRDTIETNSSSEISQLESKSNQKHPKRKIYRQSQTKVEMTQPKSSSAAATASSLISSEICDQAVMNIVLTPRNYLYASDLYRLLIFSYLKSIQKFYCLVLHVGPLVDTQEIVLYEFNIPSKIVEFINMYDRSELTKQPEKEIYNKFEVCLTVKESNSLSHSDQSNIQRNVLDLNKLESIFRITFGARLHTVADLSEYFRYYYTDCAGVKNHLEDKKDRYDRYMAKKAAKRERKQSRNLSKQSTQDSGIFLD